MTIREKQEIEERGHLSHFAVCAADSIGRRSPEPECELRTCFRRDVDRIIHSKSFRRLKHKTQVFFDPASDHYRTRMTHTIEVQSIARTISRSLCLNEDLTEAIAMGHDLGHTPFGHAGERALKDLCPGGFLHNEQGLRVVDFLEKDGRGLNLTMEVRDGILCHTGDIPPGTLEGEVVRLSDKIAYINHDIDDAVRAGLLTQHDIPGGITRLLGDSHKIRINTLVMDVAKSSYDRDKIVMSGDIYRAMMELRAFLFDRVYDSKAARGEENKAHSVIKALYEYYSDRPGELPEDFLCKLESDGIERVVCDYIAGMTDRYAISKYKQLFVPYGWQG